MSVTYSMPVGSMIEAQLVGTLHGQRTRNVFHYATGGTPSTDGEADLETFANVFDSTVGTAVRAFASNEWNLDFVTMQMLKPTRYRVVPLTVNAPGDIQFGSCPSGVAAVISRNSILSGRKYQCRNYIAGVPTSFEANSKLSAPGLAALDLIGAATSTELLINGGQIIFIPITSKVPPAPVVIGYHVQQYFPRDILHYQRRRAVGHGE